MREFTVVQDIAASVDEHWRTFFDPAFEQAIVAALKFRSYETLAATDTAAAITRKTRAVPRLDVGSSIARIFGASFGYVDDGTFDKASQVWRVHTVPDAFAHKMTCDLEMRVAPAGATSQRTLAFRIDAPIRAIGGMVESSFEKNLRSGWRDSLVFMNDWLRSHPG
jgi:hypothetical protein